MTYEIIEVKAYAIIEVDEEGNGEEIAIYTDRNDAEDYVDELEMDTSDDIWSEFN